MKIILLANTSWYLFNYCFPLAEAIHKQGNEILLVSPQGDFVDRLKAAGFRHESFPIRRRGLNPVTEWMTLRQITQLYRREKPDIVHHFTTKCIVYGSFAAHSIGIHHIVNSVTGMGYAFSGDQLPRRFLRTIVKFLYHRALEGTRVLFQNPNDLGEFLKEELVTADQTVLIRSSGVNVDKFQPVPEPVGPPLVVLAGRMLYDKGIVEFVEASRLLRARGVSARFALVGEPDIDNPAFIPVKKLQQWNDSGIVEWWGWREDMVEVYRQAHIVCLPSYREGVPKSLIEAAAAGRPIVTTDTPGCREVVQHGRNGLLVPVRSVNELADALQNLILDPEQRQRMGRESRKIAESEFKVQTILAAILAVYGLDPAPRSVAAAPSPRENSPNVVR